MQKVWGYAIATLIIGLVIGAAVGYVMKPVQPPGPEWISRKEYDTLKSERDSLMEERDELQAKVDAYEEVTHVTFRLDWLAAAQQSPWFLGKAEGYFEDEEINLEIIGGSGSSDSIKEVAAKSVDFALCDTLVLVQGIADKKMPVKAVAVYYIKTPISMIALKESGITKLGDIIGKKVGTKIGSTTYQGLQAVCAANGIDPETDIQFVSVGFGVEPLLVGQVDVLMAFTMNEPTDAISQGYEVNEIMISDYGVQLYGLTIIAHTDTVRDNPDLVRRFLRASVRSIEHAMLHPQIAVDALLKAKPDLRPEQERMAMEKMIASGILQDEITETNGTGYSTEKKWEAAQNVVYSVGLIETKVDDVNVFFTNDYLP